MHHKKVPSGHPHAWGRGDVAVADASRLATILAAMRQCLEASELERRIAEMEAALAPANATSSVVQLRSRR